MYCTDCGSRLCKELGKPCIFSTGARNLILSWLEQQFLEKSVFNKFYNFVPFDDWNAWAVQVGLPTLEELKILYPDEDLESLLFMVLDGLELSPELRSYFTEPFDAEQIEAEGFTEFRQSESFVGKSLTKEVLLKYNKKPVNTLPRPVYVKSNERNYNE